MAETNQSSDSPSSSGVAGTENQSNEHVASQTDKAGEGSPTDATGSEKQSESEITEIDCTNEVIEVTEDSFENDDDDDSAIEILDAAAFREQQQQQQATAAATTTTTSTTNDGEDSDEDLQCVGTANETKLPHNRQDCLAFRYKTSNANSNGSSICAETTSENAKFCALCYCYVCDKPASECENWYLGSKGISGGETPEDSKQSSSDNSTNDSLKHHQNHCNAVDKGSMKNLWKNMRTALKNGQDPSNISTTTSSSNNIDDSLSQYFARYTAPASSASTMAAASAMTAALAEHVRRRERHRYRAHATGRGGAHQRRGASSGEGGGYGNPGGIYGSVSMEAANNMDLSAATSSSSSRRTGAARQERRRRPTSGDNSNEQRSRHSNHRDRMRTQAILEDLYS